MDDDDRYDFDDGFTWQQAVWAIVAGTGMGLLIAWALIVFVIDPHLTPYLYDLFRPH